MLLSTVTGYHVVSLLLHTTLTQHKGGILQVMLGGMGNSILVFDMIVISQYTGICILPLHGYLEEALPVFAWSFAARLAVCLLYL